MSAQKTINRSATVPSYPVVKRHRLVWVWVNDPDLADPDVHQMGHDEWAGDGETIAAGCNYQLLLDDLMVLTHEELVDAGSIGQEELSPDPRREWVAVRDGGSACPRRVPDLRPCLCCRSAGFSRSWSLKLED